MSERPEGVLQPAELLPAPGGHARRALETVVQAAPLHVETGDSEQREDRGMEPNRRHCGNIVAIQ